MIALKPFSREHADRTFTWANDRELMFLVNRQEGVRKSDHLRWCRRIIKIARIFAIHHDDKHIGNCCLFDVNSDGRSKKAGLWIYIGDHESRGRGFGELAMRLLL